MPSKTSNKPSKKAEEQTQANYQRLLSLYGDAGDADVKSSQNTKGDSKFESTKPLQGSISGQ